MLETIPPFGSERKEVLLQVDKPGFQLNHLVFVLNYMWNDGAIGRSSAQIANTNLQVNRRFEEEAKGLPGGTSALLYLLLPIMAVFFAYEIVDGLRRGQGLKAPEFKAAYVAPAFLLAIFLNFLLLVGVQEDQNFLYATPTRFITFLFVLTFVGSAFPGIRWLLQNRLAFRQGDSKKKYLRKVLAQSTTGEIQWAEGDLQGQTWKGVLLQQPTTGAQVLGARLQLSPKSAATPTYEDLEKIVGSTGQVYRPMELIELVEKDWVNLDFQERIVQAGKPLEETVVVENLKGFTVNSQSSKPIVTLVR